MLRDLMLDTDPVAAISSDTLAPRLAAALPASGTAGSSHAGVPLLEMVRDGGWRALASAAAERIGPRATWPRAAPYDTGIITMTSGTSGKPKAIACPVASFAVAVAARHERLPYGPAEVEAVNVMFIWEALRPLCYGHTALVIPDGTRRRDHAWACAHAPTLQLRRVGWPGPLRRVVHTSALPLVAGVILDTTALAPYLAEHRATRVLSTPSLLATLLDTAAEAAAPADDGSSGGLAATLAGLSLWLLCGEVVPASLPRRTAGALPHVTLVNDYSSWEGSDVSLATLAVAPSTAKCAPVGTVLAGVAAAVLTLRDDADAADAAADVAADADAVRQVTPRGVVGELFVASPMLFTSYLGAPALTVDRLVPMPAAMAEHCRRAPASAEGALAALHAAETQLAIGGASSAAATDGAPPPTYVYRTGDLARMLPDGSLMILGRADSTIKIRGFKVSRSPFPPSHPPQASTRPARRPHDGAPTNAPTSHAHRHAWVPASPPVCPYMYSGWHLVRRGDHRRTAWRRPRCRRAVS